MDIIYVFLYLIFRHLDISIDAIKIVTLFITYTPVKYPGVSLGTLVLRKVSICLYERYYCDTFKQTLVADTGIHKVFNLTILSALLRLNV